MTCDELPSLPLQVLVDLIRQPRSGLLQSRLDVVLELALISRAERVRARRGLEPDACQTAGIGLTSSVHLVRGARDVEEVPVAELVELLPAGHAVLRLRTRLAGEDAAVGEEGDALAVRPLVGCRRAAHRG